MIDLSAEFLREDVITEINELDGKYNPFDRDTNVRIVEDIRKAIDNIADGVVPSAKHIAEVAIATNDNIQMRDFLMGLRVEKDIDYVGTYLSVIGNVITKDKCIPIATVFTTYLYEADEKEYAQEFLDKVLETNPEYSLAKLLKRVYNAQWSASEMREMAVKLHDGILNNIYEVNNDN
jgi:hypothetical protein